jgi:hypothetical protein
MQRFRSMKTLQEFSSGAQPIQSGAASRHPADLQAETLDRIDGVARPRGIASGRAALRVDECCYSDDTLWTPVSILLSLSFARSRPLTPFAHHLTGRAKLLSRRHTASRGGDQHVARSDRHRLRCAGDSPSHGLCSVADDAVVSNDPFASRANSASSRLNREGSSRKGACPVSRYQDAATDGHVFRM